MSWQLFDRIRAFARHAGIYQQERVFQDQPSLDRILQSGEFTDFSTNQAILDQTNLQINRLQRYSDYDQMNEVGEVSLALDLTADEACLTGDTRIPLLDGTCPTIHELAEKGIDHTFWVYSYDLESKKYVPAQARGARITKRNVQTVKVTLDDGASIRCTPEHLFLLRNGIFRRADELKPNDSLMPLYRMYKYRTRGRICYNRRPYPTASSYELIYNLTRYQYTHRWVYESMNNGEHPEAIHHTNYHSLDNSPNNLVGMTRDEHATIHHRCGRDNPSFNKIKWDRVVAVLEQWTGNLTRDKLCDRLGIGERVLYRLLKEQGKTWLDIINQYNKCVYCGAPLGGGVTRGRRTCPACGKLHQHNYHQKRKSDAIYNERRRLGKLRTYKYVKSRRCEACGAVKAANEFKRNGPAYSPYCNECRPTACQRRYLKKSFINHKVVSVEPYGIVDYVYDIEVPKYHCFAAGTDSSWVIVHNSAIDSERKHVLVIKSAYREVQQELEDLFFKRLLVDNNAWGAARYLCQYGDFPAEIIPRTDRKGVASLKFMNVYNFTRVETKFGDLVGFYYQDEVMQEPVFLHPWQVMHMRLTNFSNIYYPMGVALLEGGRKEWKRLKLMEDAALVYRLQRASEKLVFTVPIGNIPAKEVPEFMASVARQFKNVRFYDPRTGTFNERYSPLIQEDHLWLPQRADGTGPKVDILKGAENLDQIKDIEYFKKKMIAPLKIPYEWVGIGDGAGKPEGKSLSASDTRFAKSVQRVQREMAIGYTKVAICHLAMAGYSVEQIRSFSITMAATSAIDELYRIETWGGRTSVMADLKDLKWFPKQWIVTRFTDLSPDEIEELDEIEDSQEEEGGGMPHGGGLPGGTPSGMPELPEDGAPEQGPEEMDLGKELNPEEITGEGGNDIEGEANDISKEIAGMGETLYDSDKEKRLITEIKKNKISKMLRRIHDKDLRNATNQFEYMVESNEFDGLTTKDGKVIIEQSLGQQLITETRNEYHKALCGADDPACAGKLIQE